MMVFLLIVGLMFALRGSGRGYSRYGLVGGISPIAVLVLVLLGLYFTGNPQS